MKETVKISLEYQKDVPIGILENFRKELGGSVILRSAKDVEHWEFDHGRLVADVTILIAALPSELFSGVLGNLLTDALKSLMRGLFSKSYGWKANSKPATEIALKWQDYSVRFVIKDVLTSEVIEKCVNGFKILVESEKLQNDLHNQDYRKDVAKKSNIEYIYEPKVNLWLPVNFKENGSFIQQVSDEMNDWRD